MHVAIVDDNPKDLALLRSGISRYFGTVYLTEYESGEAFLADYRPGKLTWLFLDCYMGEVSGMDVARAVRAAGDSCQIVFTTTSPDFAVEGYKVKAAGYLVKPYGYEELAALLQSEQPKEQPFLELPSPGVPVKLLLSHILWCESRGHTAIIHTVGGGELVLRMTIAGVLERLRPYPQFLECFRGCIVNLDQVKTLSGSDFILHDGSKVPVRQRELSAVMRIFADYEFRKSRGELP